MSDGMDLALLRQLVGDVVATVPDYCTHRKLAEACERLGLPAPPGEDGHTKRERVDRSFGALPDAALPGVAERILASDSPPQPDAGTRNAIQDVLWAGPDTVEIPKRTRREIARDLDLGDFAASPDRLMALLDRLWVLGTPLDPWTDRSSSLRGQIDRHVFRNPGDWSAEQLFEELGAFEADDARFAKFLEAWRSMTRRCATWTASAPDTGSSSDRGKSDLTWLTCFRRCRGAAANARVPSSRPSAPSSGRAAPPRRAARGHP